MKTYLFITLFCFVQLASAQITLKECIEGGLANKANIQSAKTDVLLSNLKVLESKAKYLPQLTLAYEYRYNAIIASQIVPVGQFNPVPTSETRSIQFGTKWQQNTGVTLYQPIFDLTIQGRLKESKLNEKLAQIDLASTEKELKFEIAKTYTRALAFGFEVEQTAADTARTYQSLQAILSKFREGKVLKTELNNAKINHQNNLSAYRAATADNTNERIYLHYLTGLSLERLLDGPLAAIPAEWVATSSDSDLRLDSISEYQKFATRELLLQQQMKTERKKYTPTLGLQGYLGANQFSNSFDPFLGNSWFGNSYVGVSVRLPLFQTDKSANASKQLQAQVVKLQSERNDWKALRERELMKATLDVQRLAEDLRALQENLDLMQENVKLYRERLEAGQFAASDLNVQETDLQKLSSQLKKTREQLNGALIERLHISGNLESKLNEL